MRQAIFAAGLTALLGVGMVGAAGPAYAGVAEGTARDTSTGGRVTLAADTWLDQVGAALLGPIIKAAGGDAADRDNPDDGDTPTGSVLNGAGVGVAVIDSGVTPVPGLNTPGKIINGPDLSFESQLPTLRYLDTYGHGTHMAGIIAGQDPAGTPAKSRFSGVAPGAHIVSVKVASADGASDVSQVIAAIDWVVAHRNDPGMNIRVLNLSFGTDSTQAAELDPLSYAVEKAWQKGIVVVAAAGNDGLSERNLTMPAANPDVIAVGAADSRSTETRTDDAVADFTNRGNVLRHPDVLAPGRSVVSLRVPGSFIDQTYPAARLGVAADPAQRYLRGSGTSQATAVVSGAAALLLQQRPKLTPDQVKQILMSTADALPGTDMASGSGQIDIAAAARARTPLGFVQINVPSTGLGSLEASRGGVHVYDPANGRVLSGEKDIFGRPWNALTWSVMSAGQRSWSTAGMFNGVTWASRGLGAYQYGAPTWAPMTWTAPSWSGGSWTGRNIGAATWTGRSWAGQPWSGRSWSGRSWASAGWTGDPWQ